MSNTRKNCKYCNRETDINADKCPSCGASKWIRPEPVVVPPPPPPIQQNTIGSGTGFGSSHTSTTTPTTNTAARRRQQLAKKKLIIVIAIIAFIAIASSLGGSLPFVIPWGEIEASKFISVAQSRGYVVYISEDYDGHGTYWAGAHRTRSSFNLSHYNSLVATPKDIDNCPRLQYLEDHKYYVIDYTIDRTVSGARTEFNLYVNGVGNTGLTPDGRQAVSRLGSLIASGNRNDYQYHVRRGSGSSAQFGVAYRTGRVNLLAIVPVAHETAVRQFFNDLGVPKLF